MEITELDKAFAAGIMEGEGCVYATADFNLVVAIAMSDREIPDWLQMHWPGTQVRITNLKTKDGRECKPSIRWQLNGGKRAKTFIKDVLPYLRSKRRAYVCRQALSLIELIEMQSCPGKALSGEGWLRRAALAKTITNSNSGQSSKK